MIQKDISAPAAKLRHRLHQTTEPHFLYPAIAIVVLSVIWGTTLNLIKVDRAADEYTAATNTHHLAETYEAQVVRSLREIDQTLKIIQYAYEFRGNQDVLQNLRVRDLLPPALLFVVNITDSKGKIVASNHMSSISSVADRDYFQNQRSSQLDTLSVGQPSQDPETGEWQFQFSRRLSSGDGQFSGIVLVTIDAAFFVSVYESSVMGEHGLLGILGTDGVFRIKRVGETVSSNDRIDYSALILHDEDEQEIESTHPTEILDGVLRYTSTRQLYDFPMAIVVGLSADEQLGASSQTQRIYLWRAAAGSLLLILIVAVLYRMSRQLALSRMRIVEERLDKAEHDEYLAYHDSLTGLPNRSLFTKLLNQSIHQAQRYDRQLALLYIDLDGFKKINDSLGHEAGDQLLREVSTRLQDCLRESDTVSRLGGDEFIVLLPELAEDKYASNVAHKIISSISRPFILKGQNYGVTASIGISVFPQDGRDEQTLINNADTAMYQAKDGGKNKFVYYSG